MLTVDAIKYFTDLGAKMFDFYNDAVGDISNLDVTSILQKQNDARISTIIFTKEQIKTDSCVFIVSNFFKYPDSGKPYAGNDALNFLFNCVHDMFGSINPASNANRGSCIIRLLSSLDYHFDIKIEK